jgi:hypothetical protein
VQEAIAEMSLKARAHFNKIIMQEKNERSNFIASETSNTKEEEEALFFDEKSFIEN